MFRINARMLSNYFVLNQGSRLMPFFIEDEYRVYLLEKHLRHPLPNISFLAQIDKLREYKKLEAEAALSERKDLSPEERERLVYEHVYTGDDPPALLWAEL